MNGYVRTSWPTVRVVGGHQLLDAWYDRPYEYAWACDVMARIYATVGSPLQVLDVGSGAYQPWVDEMAARGHHLTSIDIDPDAVRLVRARLRNKVFAKIADGKVYDVRPYDVVTCISVIEHDPEWRVFVRNLGAAQRLILTFGVVCRDGKDGGQILIREDDVPDVIRILADAGMLADSPIPVIVPPDAVAPPGLGWLTFVGYFTRHPGGTQ